MDPTTYRRWRLGRSWSISTPSDIADIARVGGPPDWLEEASREAGHASALRALELQPGAAWSGDWSAESGEALTAEVAEVLAGPDRPTAIAVANDQMALGLIHGLVDRGFDVPGDVSITGFDDNPDSAFYRPPLTTIRLDVVGRGSSLRGRNLHARGGHGSRSSRG